MLTRAAAACAALSPLMALAQDATDWQTKAGGKMEFEVASVRVDRGEFTPPNFPLDAGDAYRPVGNRFFADFPLATFITFAYKLALSPEQREAMLARLPKWVASDRYRIQAHAQGTPTKDQMRLMMQSLLAERFKLTAHFETQEVPVLALVLVKPGKTGPKLIPHADGPPCDAASQDADSSRPRSAEVFPPVCNIVVLDVPRNGLLRTGSRDTTLDLIAPVISQFGRTGKPVVNQTGLNGRVDFSLEWQQEPDGSAPPGSGVQPQVEGPAFLDALREQLGLKLESTRGLVRTLVIDHVERPSDN